MSSPAKHKKATIDKPHEIQNICGKVEDILHFKGFNMSLAITPEDNHCYFLI